MYFCDSCRDKKNWPNSILVTQRCEVCGKTGMCNDVPAVMLIPEVERTAEQKQIFEMLQQGFKERAEAVQITALDGRFSSTMTQLVREIFIRRGNRIDWYATYQARLRAQECHRESERAKRDRR